MKVKVDDEACVGCGLCVHICPEIFEMEYEHALAISPDVPSRMEDVCKQAADDCPSSAIIITDDEDKQRVVERPKRWRF